MKHAATKSRAPGRKKLTRPDSRAIRRKRFTVGAILFALGAIVVADRAGLWNATTTSADQTSEVGLSARVVRVVDGDTFIVDLPDPVNNTPTTRVRIWGIDSPEMARDGKPAEPFAQAATRFAKDRLEGNRVVLTTEPTRVRGHYGRLLAHVEMDKGDLFSEEILRAGLARADNRWPHRWLDRLARAEREGRNNAVGIWSH